MNDLRRNFSEEEIEAIMISKYYNIMLKDAIDLLETGSFKEVIQALNEVEAKQEDIDKPIRREKEIEAIMLSEYFDVDKEEIAELLEEYSFQDILEELRLIEKEENDNTNDSDEEDDEDEYDDEYDEDNEEYDEEECDEDDDIVTMVEDTTVKYTELVEKYNEVVTELQAYKLAEEFNATVDECADMLQDFDYEDIREEFIKVISAKQEEISEEKEEVEAPAEEVTSEDDDVYDEAEEASIVKPDNYTYDLEDFDISEIFNSSEDGFVQKFESSNFIIMSENKFKKFISLPEKFPVCKVIVELDWNGFEDWFGSYKSGKFLPAKTMVADYYSFVKNNPELPLGLVIFKNFNKILPNIYLQSFIESIEENGCYNLIHPSLAKDDGKFAVIENLPNLKYIILETEDENGFDIPKTLERYRI